MTNAVDREHAVKAVAAFEKTYGAKCPKSVKKITNDVDWLVAFYGFPAKDWAAAVGAPGRCRTRPAPRPGRMPDRRIQLDLRQSGT
ncbi:IS6120-like transposase [Streptomyces lincolnensis]|uniref:IS6120-like transposase n=1 Tax=Streptomyces lincolnensis TaxID=1915 RepID=A0A1B1M1V5_STRLN|nr:hypothetical protein [Streptomyces lincolnensis]ANS62407.1 IS6120-like transposase [Streptomyces lincolnensis]AXG51332.1 IS6120-like transposase [Streptomyces lincolnensis]